MRGTKLSIISRKAKIADQKHVKPLSELKDKWDKSKPLIVHEDKPRMYGGKPVKIKQPSKREQKRLAKEKRQQEIEEIKRLDLIRKVADNPYHNEQVDLSYKEVKKRKSLLRKAKRIQSK